MSAPRAGEPDEPDEPDERAEGGGRGERDLPAHVRAGLCAACRHLRVVRSARGSVFVLCERSGSDPRYPRYPPQPVVACAGFES